jgi:hypothetical protein
MTKRKTTKPKALKAVSPLQDKVIRLLQRDGGATKAQLAAAIPEAQPAYIAALLHRILKAKGFKLARARAEGSREMTYRLPD